MKRRLLCTYDGEGTELCKTIKRLIRNQSIKNNFVHSRSQTQLRLQFQFIPFDPTQFRSTSLSTVPYLHIYFVTCNDVDVYKRTVKNDIANWFKTIEENNSNFLIIIVNGERKLQIRSSVADKIKGDFLSKYVNRLVVLYEPYRDTPKSREYCEK
ncbi:Oidioi.mRNA.OKI2018_I69.PAR.g10770.t1.cds [Oikopleura dioica]|uniref:Oidioi.mRNA.OKI2018_I69.PAR.g10770.t1.cds n=1 Tax=Oikopleura dioica TaxID=34765 RepID=A0ABN7RWK3_OIKDI|nr:Oidioi.mRNA.OKI2018_I69.PAR.g10770.t1.cds [Oikopleura dioica]